MDDGNEFLLGLGHRAEGSLGNEGSFFDNQNLPSFDLRSPNLFESLIKAHEPTET